MKTKLVESYLMVSQDECSSHSISTKQNGEDFLILRRFIC